MRPRPWSLSDRLVARVRRSFCYSAPLPVLGQAEEMVKLVVTDRAGRSVEVDGHTDISVMENIRDLDDSVDAICGGLCSCAVSYTHLTLPTNREV